jgi:hypothetical protein
MRKKRIWTRARIRIHQIIGIRIRVPSTDPPPPIRRYTEITHVFSKEYFDCPQRDSHAVHYI